MELPILQLHLLYVNDKLFRDLVSSSRKEKTWKVKEKQSILSSELCQEV